VFFPGIVVIINWKAGFSFFLFGFQFCGFEVIVFLFIRNIFDSTLEKINFPKTFNRHCAKIRKKKTPEIWKMQKKWQSSKGIFSQIWL
jgi:hypothetical protein